MVGAALRAGGLALVLLLLASAPAAGEPPRPPAIGVNPSLSPRVSLFADELVARVEVIVDRRQLDPDRVRLQARYAPYQPVGRVTVSRRDAGRLTKLRYTARLRCLTNACAPATARRRIALRPARVVYALPDGAERSLSFRWPRLLVGSRLDAADVARNREPWRADLYGLPGVSYRVPPLAARVGLLAAAALLLAAAALIALWTLGVRALPIRRRAAPQAQAPLERALELVERARLRGGAGHRRKALELLALELARHGEAHLAEDARELAWSQAAPEPEPTGALALRVRRALATARNGHGG